MIHARPIGVALALVLPLARASGQGAGGAGLPHVIALRPEALADAKARVKAGDPKLKPALDQLLLNAKRELKAPNVAVTDKHTQLPPSGDKHDYYSLSPYWWPDSAKANGLPYVRHDGVTNPESKRDLDQPRVAAMGEKVRDLSLAYYLTGDETYAAGASAQLRTWFLDAATKMNPHLRYSQLVKGNPEERGSGIIDTRWFIEAVDAAGLLEGSKSWTADEQRAMRDWFKQYLEWLRTSKNGKHEHDAKNNHGSWYAAQTTAYALFVGDTATARQLLNEIKPRIGWEITPTGEQPIEMERTRSLHYSGFNIEALSRLAEMGRTLGVDLWHYQAPEGGSLRKAIDHVAQYVGDPSKWPGQQIDSIELDLFLIHLRRGDWAYEGAPYLATLKALPAPVVQKDLSALLYPDPK